MNVSKTTPGKDACEGLLYVNFNQDSSCFSIGTESGFRIYSLSPFNEFVKREYDKKTTTNTPNNSSHINLEPGGFGIVEMINRTNFIILVGGGKNPKFPANRLLVYDDQQQSIICELEMKTEIKSIRVRKERIVIVLLNRVLVYSLSSQPQKLFSFETIDNELGLIQLFCKTGLAVLSPSINTSTSVLAFPGRTLGQIQSLEIPLTILHSNNTTNKTPAPSISIITAHESSLAALAISDDGTLVASASEKGTLIRIFETKTGKKLHEVRRGLDSTEIYSIHFNRSSTKITVASAKGTVHIFNLLPLTKEEVEEPTPSITQTGNRQSSLSYFASFLPKYFSSEWSFAYARLPVETKCICAFTYDEVEEMPLPTPVILKTKANIGATSIIPVLDPETSKIKTIKERLAVIGCDGSVYKYSFDPEKGGECKMETFHWYLKEKIIPLSGE